MKPRHAAAVALVGWYLISPPIIRIPRSGCRVNPAAKLRYWKVRGNYPSIGDCDAAGRAILKLANANSDHLPDDLIDLSPYALRELTQSLLCISSDDPRLK
jgi:hypothetical protein